VQFTCSNGLTPNCHGGGLGSIQGSSVWNLRTGRWQCNWLLMSTLTFPCQLTFILSPKFMLIHLPPTLFCPDTGNVVK